MRRLLPLRLNLPLLLAALLTLIGASLGGRAATPTARADSCVFPFTPTAYEDLKNRQLFLSAIDLASFNMLFPGDKDFGVPDLQVGPRSARTTVPGRIPPVLLKSISWIESSVTQGDSSVAFGSIGPSLIAFDCGHGITQVTTGMTLPAGDDGRGTPQQALVATNFAYNIARGAYTLATKWNDGGNKLPIAGVDTNGSPQLLENWYYAVWAYNGFTGPGASRSNHPLDPIYGTWPRTPYSCGPTSDGKGHNRGNYPYQELVFGCVTNPPVVDGNALWSAQSISLPNLNDPNVRSSMALSNFIFPYSKMDIPTSEPFHLDNTPQPDASARTKVIGAPVMAVDENSAHVGYDPTSGSTVEVVDVSNTGTGVLTWYAVPSASWLQVLPFTGVAVGTDLPCAVPSQCDRTGHLQISIDTTKAPPGHQTATVTIQALGTNQQSVVNVDISQVSRMGVPGVSHYGSGSTSSSGGGSGPSVAANSPSSSDSSSTASAATGSTSSVSTASSSAAALAGSSPGSSTTTTGSNSGTTGATGSGTTSTGSSKYSP